MSEELRCDQCGATAPSFGLIGWLRVERLGIDVTSHGEDPTGRWDFCSWSCVAAFAEGRRR